MKLGAIAVGLTVAHLAAAGIVASSGPDEVTRFEAPGPAPEIAELAPAGCRLVVFFRPDCSACNRAAKAQAEQLDEPGFDLVWIAARPQGVDEFDDQLHPSSRVVVDSVAWQDYQVTAVPAGFLIREGVVLEVSGLTGKEPWEVFESRCSA